MRLATSITISVSDRLKEKEMRKRFQSGLTGLLFGGLWGGLAGAILIGLYIYLDETSYFWGTARLWMWLFMIMGFIWGSVVGGSLGAVIGVTHVGRFIGTLIGLAIGLLSAVILLYGRALIYDRFTRFVFAVIVSCSFLGWLISSVLQAREHARGTVF
jgi:hypothetical protein